LEAALADSEELREKNRFLQNELRTRDGTLAENEEQLEEMEVCVYVSKSCYMHKEWSHEHTLSL
jgi:hypothetical protein